MSASGRERWFRLRGEVGGALRTFLLVPGENRLGSLPTNDVVLPVSGVSRRHALLVPGAEGVAFRDLGSKNGMRVGGRRLAEGVLQPGDRVRVGPVSLTVEEIELDDARLAIVLPASPPTGHSGSPDTSATRFETPTAGEQPRWLAAIEEIVTALRRRPRPGLSGALGVLGRHLGATGASLTRCHDGAEPVVVAASGRFGPKGRPEADLPRPRPGAAEGEGGLFGGADGGPAGAWLSTRTGSLVLALWGVGELGERAALVALVLRLLAAFVETADDEPPVPQTDRGGAELTFAADHVVCPSPAMAVLYREMLAIADTGLPVLLRGETGVGKELLARSLHLSSRRADGPFVAINCAAIPADLLEAEMFGIGKGVATGVEPREGCFRLADGGTLMLDEVGDMPRPLQTKLLRALDAGEIQPVGRPAQAVDVRIVAATAADLKRSVARGRLREDLYYRLAGVELVVPPLRRRREDVPPLVEHFVRRAAEQTGKRVRGVSWKALERLTAHSWPGNVRELQHEATRLVHRCPDGGVIDSTLLSAAVAAGAPAAEEVSSPAGSLRLADHVEPLERRLIRAALERTGGNRTRAAELLGLSRNGLAYKMKNLGLDG